MIKHTTTICRLLFDHFGGLALKGLIKSIDHKITLISSQFFWVKIINKRCYIWDKVFKNEPSKICGRQSLKNLKSYGLLRWTISL